MMKVFRFKMAGLPELTREYRKRNVTVKLDVLGSQLDGFPWEEAEDAKEYGPGSQGDHKIPSLGLSFDSAIEKEFHEKLSSSPSLLSQVRRDADIILVPEIGSERVHVIIPDFQVQYHGQSLFIEIVGYWTEKYKARKLQQLEWLLRVSPAWQKKMLLVIDKSIEFPKTSYPSFYYEKGRLPVKKVLECIKKWENDIFSRAMGNLQQRMLKDITSFGHQYPIISSEVLQQSWGLASTKETWHMIEQSWKALGLHEKFVKLPPDTLVPKKILKEWLGWAKQVFSSRKFKSISRKVLIEDLPESLPERLLDRALRKGGYKFKYSNLLDVEVFPPEEKN
jgi:hypothetical protein